jgi:hypothetical protein
MNIWRSCIVLAAFCPAPALGQGVDCRNKDIILYFAIS